MFDDCGVIVSEKEVPHRAQFLGGLEAKLLKQWHVELLRSVKPQSMFFAYDTADDYEPLVAAGKLLKEADITINTRIPCAYVLIGYPKDTIDKAEKRMYQTLEAGFIPFAMLYKDEQGNEDRTWRKFSRLYARPAIIYANNKAYFQKG